MGQPTGGLEALLPLVIIQLIFMAFFWKLAVRTGMNKVVYVILHIIPMLGSFVWVYLFGRALAMILDKLDAAGPATPHQTTTTMGRASG